MFNKKEYKKRYYQEHKKKHREYYKIYNQDHKVELKKQHKEYQQEHKEKINLFRKNKRKIDINFKIFHNLRSRLWAFLKGINKSETTMKLLGCSIEKLREHLQSQFRPGMTWQNYGKWEIDHIRPGNSFDLSKEEEQCKCFNWTNLQPLWAKENLEKSDNIPG